MKRRTALTLWVTQETTGGALLLLGAAVALFWANSPWREAYFALSELTIGPPWLSLSLAHWASDGLLAIFFFVVGLELKQEIVTGSLRHVREAAVPVLAAVGGMITPAVVFSVLIIVLEEPAALHGWAIPTATDIAFALAVLAVCGRALPRDVAHGLRTFLLTLAVVDDFLAILVIAVFFTSDIAWLPLCGALGCVGIFALLSRVRHPQPWLLVPLAFLTWVLMHESGVHATIAGVLLGMVVPAHALFGQDLPRAVRFDLRLRPFSSGLVLPVFAFFAAGVSLADGGGIHMVTEPVFLAVAIALVAGKFLGVMGTTALVTKTTPLRLPQQITLRDLIPIAALTGIGFTVALLMAELSYTDDTRIMEAKAAILCGSLLSALLGALGLFRARGRGEAA